MSEEIVIATNAGKEERYKALLPQIDALVEGEPNRIANLANIVAALKTALDFFWVGFYKVYGDELVLGPFQGPVACTRIKKGSGVCGTSWLQKQTIIVDDVDQFPGHIACSSDSKSEIVIPVIKDGDVQLVLDVDSDRLHHFDEIDKQYLEMLCSKIEGLI